MLLGTVSLVSSASKRKHCPNKNKNIIAKPVVGFLIRFGIEIKLTRWYSQKNTMISVGQTLNIPENNKGERITSEYMNENVKDEKSELVVWTSLSVASLVSSTA